MRLSVIVASRNRYPNLVNTVRALVNQIMDKNDYEIIISDDNSSDETFSIYKDISTQIKAKYVNNNTKPHTWNASIPRNLGALISDPDSKAFVFIDSDVILPADGLQHFWEDYEANPARVIIGPYDFMNRDGTSPLVVDVRKPKFELVNVSETFGQATDGLACFGGNLMIPKEIFWSVGGFSPDIHIGLEDGDMGLKLWKVGTHFSYDIRLYAKHQFHDTPNDRFPNDMKNHIDNLNLKHFHTKDPDYGIIEASREAYASWGIEGWTEPPEWRRMQIGLKITKDVNNKK